MTLTLINILMMMIFGVGKPPDYSKAIPKNKDASSEKIEPHQSVGLESERVVGIKFDPNLAPTRVIERGDRFDRTQRAIELGDVVDQPENQGLVIKKLTSGNHFRDLSLCCYRGQITGLFHPVDEKTGLKLARVLAGLDTASSGDVFLQGVEALSKSTLFNHYSSSKYFKNFSFVSPSVDLLPYLTGREMLGYVAVIKGLSYNGNAVDFWIKYLEVEDDLLKKQCSNMITPRASLVKMACACLGRPKLLVLHEPFNGMEGNPVVRQKVINGLEYLAQGPDQCCILILSRRIYREYETLCDRVAFMYDGKMNWIMNPDYMKLVLSNTLIVLFKFDDEADPDGRAECASMLETDFKKNLPELKLFLRMETGLIFNVGKRNLDLTKLYATVKKAASDNSGIVTKYHISNPSFQDILDYRVPMSTADINLDYEGTEKPKTPNDNSVPAEGEAGAAGTAPSTAAPPTAPSAAAPPTAPSPAADTAGGAV